MKSAHIKEIEPELIRPEKLEKEPELVSLILDEIVVGGVGVSFDDIAGLEVGNLTNLHPFRYPLCFLNHSHYILVGKASFARNSDSSILKT